MSSVRSSGVEGVGGLGSCRCRFTYVYVLSLGMLN